MYFDLQRASMLKRISARILDMILVAILATGFGLLTSAVIGYDAKYEKVNQRIESYQKQYGVTDTMMEMAEYGELTPEELEACNAMDLAMAEDMELAEQYGLVISMTFVILTVGFLLAFAVTDFVIPLCLKQGQTVGKKVFGLCLMQTDHTKLRTTSLAIRTFLGRFTIETMVPVLICAMIFFGFLGIAGTITIVLLLIVQIILIITTETNSVIHDVLSQTVVVDEKSQKIFESMAELDEYKKNIEQTTKKGFV